MITYGFQEDEWMWPEDLRTAFTYVLGISDTVIGLRTINEDGTLLKEIEDPLRQVWFFLDVHALCMEDQRKVVSIPILYDGTGRWVATTHLPHEESRDYRIAPDKPGILGGNLFTNSDKARFDKIIDTWWNTVGRPYFSPSLPSAT